MGDIFLSYSRADRDAVANLVRRLESRGFSIWWDGDIPPGENYRTFIDKKLDEAPAICVVWSSDSVRSRWVAEEAEEGVNRQNLIPISIEAADIPRGFKSFQSVQLLNTLPAERYEEEFEKLVAQLTKFTQAASTRKPKARKSKPSALSYPAAKAQNVAMMVAFTAVCVVFVLYDLIVQPDNLDSFRFRLTVLVPTFFVMTLFFFLSRRAWHLWILSVLLTPLAVVLTLLQLQQFELPEFSYEGFGATVNVILVLVLSGAGLVHSHSSRFFALVSGLAAYAVFMYLQGARDPGFWFTAMTQPLLIIVFLCLGFYLRDRRAR